MTFARKIMLSVCLAAVLPVPGYAAEVKNKSFQGHYKTTAHSCMAGRCNDQDETLTSSFFIGERNVHVYAGANKGLVLPFGRPNVSSDGQSMWIVPTAAGFDETYARDGFTITHHYAMRSDGTCSISVSVVNSPAKVTTRYRTEMESCKVADGNIFAAK